MRKSIDSELRDLLVSFIVFPKRNPRPSFESGATSLPEWIDNAIIPSSHGFSWPKFASRVKKDGGVQAEGASNSYLRPP